MYNGIVESEYHGKDMYLQFCRANATALVSGMFTDPLAYGIEAVLLELHLRRFWC